MLLVCDSEGIRHAPKIPNEYREALSALRSQIANAEPRSARRSRTVSGLRSLAVLLFFGCNNEESEAPTTKPQVLASGSMSAIQANIAARDHVYRVGCTGSLGTGFTDKAGRIITARHNVVDCNPCLLMTKDGRSLTLTMIGEDAALDMAIMQPSEALPPGLVISDTRPAVGAELISFGFPLQYFGVQPIPALGHYGDVAPKRNAPSGPSWSWISIALSQGNSGGPVIDASTSRVTGLVSQRMANFGDELLVDIETIAAGALSASSKPDPKEFARKLFDRIQANMSLGVVLSPPTEQLFQFVGKHQ